MWWHPSSFLLMVQMENNNLFANVIIFDGSISFAQNVGWLCEGVILRPAVSPVIDLFTLFSVILRQEISRRALHLLALPNSFRPSGLVL